MDYVRAEVEILRFLQLNDFIDIFRHPLGGRKCFQSIAYN